MRIENLSDHYPEELRPHNALLRFTIARPKDLDVTQWRPLPAPSDGRAGGKRRPKQLKKA
ncbi:hypothetical protein NGF19_02170 [Streptomyces sp. RY43-2]|uniref:Transposase n=1 Tax=Streptomyces macrolidinus TaxID=2952607 RepID=A0ABT0Z9U9_9ACTN|nr:hypothetical protein [Streptomyces macrolidinus]MCN9239596.1 hypothetical protein [Streptomyces macrolidinus]